VQDFFGNRAATETLLEMIRGQRIPQTLLFSGPEGIGKATLARRVGATLLGDATHKIEQDDLSLDANSSLITEREKWTADKRNEDPLLFSSHPDFVTFAPDGRSFATGLLDSTILIWDLSPNKWHTELFAPSLAPGESAEGRLARLSDRRDRSRQ